MEKSQVIKVKYNDFMCRITAAKSANGEVISFDALEERVRASFKLAPGDKLSFTYADSDGDVINLSSDCDIVDALLYQQLNPLRIELKVSQAEAGTHAAGTQSPISLSSSASFSSDASRNSAAAAAPAAAAAAAAASSATDKELKGGPVEAVQDLCDMIEKQLREALGVDGEVGRLAKEFEPLLKVAPSKIAQVFDAALKSGLSVSFEPVFEPGAVPFEPGSLPVASPDAVNTVTHWAPAAAMKAPAVGNPAPAAVEKKAAAKEGQAPAENVPAPAGDPGLAGLLDTTGAAAAAASAAAAAATQASASAAAAAQTCAAAAAAAPGYPVMHNGIICDGCDMNPIMGNRYKSLVRHDYDLCEGCHKKSNADPAHYQCLTVPVFRPRRHMHHHPGHFRGAAWTSPNQAGGRPMRCGPPSAQGWPGRAPYCRQSPFAAAAGAADGKLEARFVCDVSIPDGIEVPAGTRFTKIWRMRNTGAVPWPQHSQIVHIGGDALGERSAVMLQVPEGGVPPDAEVDVCVDMVAPARLGRYMSHWRLCAPGGPKFGHRVWALVQVVNPGTVSNPVPTPVPAQVPVIHEPEAASAPQCGDDEESDDELPSRADLACALLSPSFGKDEEKVDPIVAAVRAAIPPAPVKVEEVLEDPVPAGEAQAAVASSAVEVVDTDPTAAAEDPTAAAEGYVEVPSEAAAAPSPTPASGPAPASAASVESTTVGSFSLVDRPVAKVADAQSDAAAVDGYVDAGVAPPEGSAPNGEAPGAAAVKAAAAAREKMFEIEDEEEADALDQLEGMGFEDRQLNHEVLRKTSGNLVLAIEALMGQAEWDPMLAELEEMGFEDKMLNKRMMFKNSGNVKGALKDLVHFYKNQ